MEPGWWSYLKPRQFLFFWFLLFCLKTLLLATETSFFIFAFLPTDAFVPQHTRITKKRGTAQKTAATNSQASGWTTSLAQLSCWQLLMLLFGFVTQGSLFVSTTGFRSSFSTCYYNCHIVVAIVIIICHTKKKTTTSI